MTLFKKMMAKIRHGDLMPLLPLGVGALLAVTLQLYLSRTTTPPEESKAVEAEGGAVEKKGSRRSKTRKAD